MPHPLAPYGAVHSGTAQYTRRCALRGGGGGASAAPASASGSLNGPVDGGDEGGGGGVGAGWLEEEEHGEAERLVCGRHGVAAGDLCPAHATHQSPGPRRSRPERRCLSSTGRGTPARAA
jgi:hypothetical protein